MNKKIVLIVVLILAICLTMFACKRDDSPSGNEPEIKLEYDRETGVLSWYCQGASGYRLQILKSDGTAYPLTDDKIYLTQITLTALLPDTYTVNLTVYIGDKEYKKSINFVIGSDEISSGDEGGEIIPPVHNKVVEQLLPAYYYKKGDEELALPLTSDSGIREVSAFGLSGVEMYSYDENTNSLILNQNYFSRFSTGFRTQIDIIYNDGKEDSTYVQIVDNMPLQVEGLVDDTFIYDAKDLNYLSRELVFFYNDSLVNLSSSSLKGIYLDGKKLSLGLDYSLYSSSSKIKFTFSFLNSVAGKHLLEVYTSWGKTILFIDVKSVTPNYEKYPYDIDIDFDSSYPNVYIEWTMHQQAKYYVVQIGDKKYYSFTNPELFDGCRFNATGKISKGDTVRITAEFDGKGYESIESASLDVDILDENISAYLSYDNSFAFMGKEHNYYIRNEDDLRDLVYYMLIYYNELPESDIYDNLTRIYADDSYIVSRNGLESEIQRLSLQYNEAIKGSFCVVEGDNYGEYLIYGDIDSTCVPNSEIRTTTMIKGINDVHYSATGRSDDYDGFAINSAELKASVKYSEELYVAVERGVCPVPVESSEAYLIYERAKEVLRKIIDDSMTDYQKVHAISDWLADNVAYDYELEKELSSVSSSSPEYDKFYAYRSLYLEGVFIDGVAVCNGYAKAVSLLCGIEGIPCYKIKGSSSSGQHAWNKVYADGLWYVVDTTWAVKRYPDSQSNTEILQHQYLFMSESTSGNNPGGKHYEQYTGLYTGCYAGEDYNLYANTFFVSSGVLCDYVIDSAYELQLLVDYYKKEYGYRMLSGKYILVDVACSYNALTNYIKSLDKNAASQYTYTAVQYSNAKYATIKITRK